jgi:murein DD-endopeptidase MepM/ murein hydrolase activator NlpD
MIIERMSSWTRDTWSHGVKLVQEKKNRRVVGILASSLFVGGIMTGGYTYQANRNTLYHASVERQEVIETMTIPYLVKQQNDPTKYRDEEPVVIEGNNGRKQVVFEVVKKNGKLVHKKEVQQKILEPPVAKVVVRGTKVKSSRGDGHFQKPAVGVLSSYYGMRWGRMHEGIDIATPIGTPIHSSDHGRVVFVGEKRGYGKCIIVDHSNGYRTLYGHLNAFFAKEGDIVVKGETIAESGNTGRSTGPHLHFEIQKNGQAVDPLPYLH